ncbi:MAG: ABC transporter substrate-binding protein [Alphaproteobacteria bacterium]
MMKIRKKKQSVARKVVLGALLLSAAIFGAPAVVMAQGDDRPELVIGISGLPPHLMPGRISNTHNRLKMIYADQLIARDYGATPQGDGAEIIPWLAESWTQIEPTLWEFKLRQDVEFHDGTMMTAKDVVFSFAEGRLWGDSPTEPQGSRYFNGGLIANIEAVDDFTVRIETHDPDIIMPLRFVSPVGFVVSKDHYEKVGADAFFLNPVTTGPYKLVRFERNTIMVFEAFDNYWRGKPPVKKITLREVPELSARIAGLISGEFDIVTDIEPELVTTVERYDDLKTVKVNYENQVMIVISTLHPVTKDPRIRKALVHALDREAIVASLWGGATNVPKPFAFKFYKEYYDETRESRPFDPELAKKLLKEAGYNGEPLNLRIRRGGYPKIEDAGQILVEMWKQVGINVQLEIRKGSAQASDGIADGEVAMISWSNGIHIPDPVTPVWATWGPNGTRAVGKPEASWDHPENYLEVGRKFESATDPDERFALFKELVDIWVDETPGFALWMRADWFGMRKGVDWKPYSFFYLDFGPGNLTVAK